MGPFVRRREEMKKLNLTTVLKYLQHLQAEHDDEAAVKHLELGIRGGYKRSRKKKRRKSRNKKKKRKTKRRKHKTRRRRR